MQCPHTAQIRHHGAGIIAASANNGIGGTGVAFNAKIMAIKSFGYAGTGTSTDIAEGIYYAVENGADIINMSFGSYSASSLVKDALQVAFGTSVLVAAAGNDGRGNLSCPEDNLPIPANLYPAAYNWVLGVQATQQVPNPATNSFLAPYSNYDCVPGDSHEYELLAPGSAILSTLPGSRYSTWSGTSMATPVISGIAAFVKTKFADPDVHSSRFIMGQLTVGRASAIDAERVLTETPIPDISLHDLLIIDSAATASNNDSDGNIDAGEVIDLGVTIRNQWGYATNVTVTADASYGPDSGPDPYVTFVSDTVEYGSIGSFNQSDNGITYDQAGSAVAATTPFRLQIAPDTPNGHVIPLRFTITSSNGIDSSDDTTYTSVSTTRLAVQRGRSLSSIISEDLTLDAAYILQKAVGLIAGSFPNAGTNWVFTPAQRAFTGLAADQTSQHFTGILLGDLSGNWADAGGGGGQGSSVQATPSVVSIGSGLVTAAGGSVQLPVTLARGDADIYAADLTITYDPTKVSVSDNPVTLGNAAAGMTLAVNAETPGILRIALASPTAIPADGTLLLLDLVAAADLSADVTVSFGAIALYEGRVTLSAEDGSIVVDTVAPTAAFGSVISPRSTAVDSITLEFSEQVTGLLLDGRIDSRDINALLLSGLFQTPATNGHWYQGDFTYDGRVNSLDISRLLLTGLMNTGSYLPARGQGGGASATGLGSGGGSGAATGDSDSSGDAATNSTGSASTSSVMGPEPPPSHSRGDRAVLVRPPTGSSLDATQLAFAAIAVSPESPGNAKPNAELLRP